MITRRTSGLKLLHEAVEEHALHHPSSIAVDDGRGVVSYGELDQQTNQLSWLLRALGCGSNTPVGILIGNSAEATIGVVGALKAACCYVPMNPEFPAQKLRSIAEASNPTVIITRRSYLELLTAILEGNISDLQAIVLIDSEPEHELSATHSTIRWFGPQSIQNAARVNVPPQLEDDLAYIMFTSGTTGKPKGVMVSHRNAMNLVCWAVDFFQIAPGDRMSGH